MKKLMHQLMIFVCCGRFPDEPSFVLPQCLKKMVESGNLGRKTGKGFYHWDGDKRGDPVQA
jgi:3-hydroxyacyl-CoA dehydrogenase